MGWLWVSNLSIAISTLLTTKEKEEVCVSLCMFPCVHVSVCVMCVDECYTQHRRTEIDEWKYCSFI